MAFSACNSAAYLASVALLILLLPATIRADGGTVRASEVVGPVRVTIFTTPTPLRAGPIDVSVLVQNATTGEPQSDARITVYVSRAGSTEAEVAHVASSEAATNRLFQAVSLDCPAGRWDLRIEVRAAGETVNTQCDMEVGPAAPRWQEVWFWIALPLVPIGLYVLGQWGRRRHTTAGRAS